MSGLTSIMEGFHNKGWFKNELYVEFKIFSETFI